VVFFVLRVAPTHLTFGGRNGSEWSRNVYWNFHETNLRMRAAAGRMWIVTADNCYPEDVPCSCPSGVLKPDGSWAVQAKEQGRDLVTYTIEFGYLYD